MKIIFLDIDGVLNSDVWFYSSEYKNKEFPFNQFEPRLIKLFNRIIEETQAKVVLTSTWRLKYSLQEMIDIFQKVGIICEIIDFTPDLKIGNDYVLRGNEILKWCKDNQSLLGVPYLQYRNFVIIDDHSDMLYWQQKYFFQTDAYCGLTPSLSKNIIRELTK